jgi:RNA polymerase sigma-70 factor, ECF subfamily
MLSTNPPTAEVTLEALWNQLHERLFHFINSRAPSADDAQDILQEVFLRIHSNLEHVRELDRLESWVYQIARNCIIDFYRSQHPTEPLQDYPLEDEPTEPDILADLSPYIHDLVDSLPEPYRQALIMTEYQGLSQKDLALQLGLSFSGAKSRVQRARQKVQDLLLACCHFEFDVRGMICCFREGCCVCCEQQI